MRLGLSDRSCEVRGEGLGLRGRSYGIGAVGCGVGSMGSELWAVWG